MLQVNEFNRQVAARLLDFFNSATPWHRRLWNIGLLLTLRETLEASEAVRQGVLGPDSLQTLVNSAMKLAGTDPGAGDSRQRQFLQQALKPDLKFSGLDYLTVRDIVADIEQHYLERWAKVLSDVVAAPRLERTARAIASHLMDVGFSSDHLHRWWTFKVKHEKEPRTLPEVILDAHRLATSTPPKYEILVALESVPKTKSMPQRWLDATSVSGWLRKNGFDTSEIRQKGGMLIAQVARDPISAVEAVQETLDKLAARVTVRIRGTFKPTPVAWVAGETSPLKMGGRRRGVQIHALQREEQIYSDAKPSKVDAAIELLAPLASSSPSVAVAGGWAAIEALLSEPKDRGSAAERMASLVACSFPRAELTPLAYILEKAGGLLADQLKACRTNRDRSELVAAALLKGELVPFENDSDSAAVARLKCLLTAPHIAVADIEAHLVLAFRRLYRQRNLVLHGGYTDAVALRACLRTVAPLAGAGMDRIAHAWFVEGIEPLELAARARIRIARLGPTDGIKCIDLLS